MLGFRIVCTLLAFWLFWPVVVGFVEIAVSWRKDALAILVLVFFGLRELNRAGWV